ncbi:hypothetical protein HUU39_11590 [candidate division KSB1 bacterium]|nr:hypothetical protein [bacterium]NUM65900.1 hypothetical protein [candidate division KSB1 bacterium]
MGDLIFLLFMQNSISGLQPSADVQKSVIASTIAGATTPATGIETGTLKLIPEPWCQRSLFKGDDFKVSFVEQAVLGDVFAYDKILNITGALKLTLPASIIDAEKTATRNKVRDVITAYLDNLKSQADVVFADIIAIAAEVEPVLAVDLDPDDFRVALNDTEETGRISKEKIEIREFEKARLDNFCITDGVETVQIEVTAVTLTLTTEVTDGVKDALRTAVANVINNFLSSAKPGEDVIYANLKNALLNILVVGASYNVTELTLSAISASDDRTQGTDISTAKDIHVRSVEIAVMSTFAESAVTIIDPQASNG